MKYFTGIILSLCCFTVYSLESGVEIKVATEEYKDSTNADGTGAYFEIIQEIYKDFSPKISPIFAPYARIVKMVETKKADFWVASYPEEEEFVQYPKCTFDYDIVSALTLKTNNIDWKGDSSLANQPVSWVRGYAYDEYFPEIKFGATTKVAPIEQGIKMLEKGRVKFYLDATSEIDDILDSNPKYKASMEKHEVGKIGLYMAFADTNKGRELRDAWDKNFPQLVSSGKMTAINKKWGFEEKDKNYVYCPK
jgi:polar amino acid transport system substrate-binding protein